MAKWLKRVLILVGMLALVAIMAYFLLLPLVARAQVKRALDAMGISSATFELRHASLSEIELEAVRLGAPEWGRIDSVHATYSVRTLWHGRINTMTLNKLQWRIKFSESGIELGPERTPTAQTEPLEVPFERILAPDALVIIEKDGNTIELKADATFTRKQSNAIEVKIDANWPDLKAAAFVRGQIDLGSGGRTAHLTANVPTVELADPEPLLALIPALQSAHVSGTFAANADFFFEDGTLKPNIKISGSNVQYQRGDSPVAIDSASGAITITSLAPILTPPAQQIVVQKARIGELDVEDANIQFQLAAADRLNIEKAIWSMGEYGRFAAAPFSLNPADPRFETTLAGQNINLGRWLDLLTNGRAKGEGLLKGTVNVAFAPGARDAIQFGEGVLQQQADGWVHIADADLLAQTLSHARPASLSAEQWQQVQGKVREALRDYQYSVMRIDFIPHDDDVLCRIQTSGRGRKGPDPLEFGLLTVNVNNFNHVFNEAIRFSSALKGME